MCKIVDNYDIKTFTFSKNVSNVWKMRRVSVIRVTGLWSVFLIWLLGKSGNKWVLLLTVPAANPRPSQPCVCLRRVRSGRVGSGRVRGPAPTLSVFWSCCSSFSCLLVQICHIDTQQCLLHVIVRYVQTAELADLRAAKELCNSSVSGLMWSDAWCLMWPCFLPSAPGLGWGKAPQMSLSAEGGGDTFIKANRMPFGHGGYCMKKPKGGR